jgi:NitT/TauT family transport system permease protein
MKDAAAVAAATTTGASVARRNPLSSMRRYLFSRQMALRLVSLLVVGSVWQAWGSANPFFASYPTQIADAAGRIFFPEILPAFITTLTALAVGLVIATPIGMALGFAIGRSRLVEVILLPYVNAFYATPRIALIPILVMWLGIDFNLRITIVALGAVFPIIVNTYSGSRHVDTELLDTGRAFMATPAQVLRTIVIPYSSPYVFAGFRIGISRGISGVITAEMTAALTGVGRILISKAKYLSTDELFVGIMTLGIFSLLLVSVLVRVQHKLTPWALPERRV